MGDSFQSPGSGRNNGATNLTTSKKVIGKCLVASSPKSFAQESLNKLATLNRGKIGSSTPVIVAVFLLKVAALEAVRRFSRVRYPFIWSGLQALQVFCYPPFRWIQRWGPFSVLVKGMQMLSRPLLVLSVVTAFTDESGGDNDTSAIIEESHGLSDSQVTEAHSDVPPVQSLPHTVISDEASQNLSPTNWLRHLYTELENQGINLPGRINEDELRRFYTAANGDFTCLLSSVKKTIRWRETYRILSSEELEVWSKLVFWHGFDVKHRPCLIVRLGLVCISLKSNYRPRFAQAVVSQVEYGALHLIDRRNPQITVLVDCEGLTSLRFPMQMLRSCSALLQDNFPNLLGCLFVIRLPPVARVIAQTFIQVLKPVTCQKLNMVGGMYRKVLYDNLQTIPSYLGGICTCTTCENLSICSPRVIEEINMEQRNVDTNDSNENLPLLLPDAQHNMYMNSNNCDQVLRSAVVGILIFWVLIALLAGIYDLESRPVFTL